MALSSRGWETVDTGDFIREYPAAMLAFAEDVGAAWYAATVTVAWGANTQISNTAAVTFPAGRFSAAPIVVVSPRMSGNRWHAMAYNITASGCTVQMACGVNQNQITGYLQLLAIQAG